MKVLVIEDSERLRRALVRGLRDAGFVVDAAEDGEEGLSLATTSDYEAIVLDVLLPKLSGLEVLTRLRGAGRSTHVLILSAKDQIADRVRGLQLGADDYLVKPFAFAELVARLQALVRRSTARKDPRLAVGPLEIDTARRRVAHRGLEVHLTPSEYRLLEWLACHRGRVFSQEALCDQLHDRHGTVASNVVEVLVSGLRRKLDVPGQPSLIQTRRGFGYLIE
jgi:DNA-binding response OmpR family regulator